MDDTQRIAIVGCGFVGVAAARELVGAGHNVVGTTTTTSRCAELLSLGVTPVVLRICETERLRELLRDRDGVVLCVAPGRSGQTHREVYVEGARSLVEAILPTTVARVVYTSSTRVYGQDDGSWVDETSTAEPVDRDGQALLEAERVLLGMRDVKADVAVAILRLGGIHGPGRSLVDRIRRAAGTVRDDGDAFVNLAHVGDIVSAIARLPALAHHGVMNLTDGRPLRRRELYDRVLAASGLRPIEWVAPVDPVSLGKRVRSDLIRRALGLSPRPALD